MTQSFGALGHRTFLGETGDGFEAELRALASKTEEARKKEAAEWAQLSRGAFGGLVPLALFVFLFFKVDDTAQTIMLAAVTYVFVETITEASARRGPATTRELALLPQTRLPRGTLVLQQGALDRTASRDLAAYLPPSLSRDQRVNTSD